jgi:ribosome-associated translation inhibitor RaiA
MDIIIQSLGFNAGESLEAFIREKAQTLKSDKIVRVNVAMYKGPAAEPDNVYCEIRLEIPGNDLFVKRHSPHFQTAVSECIDVLNTTLQRTRERQIDHNRQQKDEIALNDTKTEAPTDALADMVDDL